MSILRVLVCALLLSLVASAIPAAAQTPDNSATAQSQNSPKPPDSAPSLESPRDQLWFGPEHPRLKAWLPGPVSSLGDQFCLHIRSYQVARDDPHSDSTHLVHTSTCQPASRFQVKTADLIQIPAQR